ncbi:hypothetical protein GWI33_019265 [Rhynchophorus ferrugineus]|uniref:Myotubularin-related protein 14 n=1 Tax=Rhynchophorus ferrugineus TaxID=354439 RepID=A0A834M773_RHYFE|nr:hypothetical protein GWI33_019265 [Rhynchophorus ferrugineus]
MLPEFILHFHSFGVPKISYIVLLKLITMGEPESAITAFNEATICDVLSTFVATTYHADKENKKNPYIDAVIFLMEKDYKVIKLPNESGNLSFQYPNIIPIMESSRHVTTIYENEENETPLLDSSELLKLCEKAKFARCRQRFPVPVILFNGQHICRSATLASVPEICYRGNYSFNGTEFLKALLEFLWPSEESGPELPSADAGQYESKLPKYCDTVRNDDMKLLKALNVFNIVDIMVERRKVKHGLYVSASEKVDRERYKDFRLMSLPYPGCEFFVNFHNNLLKPESLFYDWSDPSNDAELTIPNDDFQNCMNISWERYKYWDLVYMTQNYLKYIIKRLQDDNCGLLLHCISGWDRTPLFISLLRLSLWADGLVHDTLSEYEILYLTLTYDWYLFGHHLSNRMAKNEEIMAFCFEMLKYIIGDEYSGKPSKKRVSEESANSATNPCPLEEVDCRDKLSTGTSDSNVNGSPIYTNYDESMVQDNDSPPQLSSEKVTTGSVKSSPIASPSNKLRNGSGMSKTIEALTFENQTTTASDCSPASNGGESKEQEKTTCVTRVCNSSGNISSALSSSSSLEVLEDTLPEEDNWCENSCSLKAPVTNNFKRSSEESVLDDPPRKYSRKLSPEPSNVQEQDHVSNLLETTISSHKQVLNENMSDEQPPSKQMTFSVSVCGSPHSSSVISEKTVDLPSKISQEDDFAIQGQNCNILDAQLPQFTECTRQISDDIILIEDTPEDLDKNKSNNCYSEEIIEISSESSDDDYATAKITASNLNSAVIEISSESSDEDRTNEYDNNEQLNMIEESFANYFERYYGIRGFKHFGTSTGFGNTLPNTNFTESYASCSMESQSISNQSLDVQPTGISNASTTYRAFENYDVTSEHINPSIEYLLPPNAFSDNARRILNSIEGPIQIYINPYNDTPSQSSTDYSEGRIEDFRFRNFNIVIGDVAPIKYVYPCVHTKYISTQSSNEEPIEISSESSDSESSESSNDTPGRYDIEQLKRLGYNIELANISPLKKVGPGIPVCDNIKNISTQSLNQNRIEISSESSESESSKSSIDSSGRYGIEDLKLLKCNIELEKISPTKTVGPDIPVSDSIKNISMQASHEKRIEISSESSESESSKSPTDSSGKYGTEDLKLLEYNIEFHENVSPIKNLEPSTSVIHKIKDISNQLSDGNPVEISSESAKNVVAKHVDTSNAYTEKFKRPAVQIPCNDLDILRYKESCDNSNTKLEHTKMDNVRRLEINEQEVAASESKITGLLADAMGTTMKCSTNLTGSKTSPVTIGSPCSRQRSSSTGSTSSNVSGNWVLINECGSVEQDQGVKPCRQFRLERVRTIFMSSYQKTVKMDSYGPQKGIVEDLVLYISSLLTSSSNVTDQQNSTPQQ